MCVCVRKEGTLTGQNGGHEGSKHEEEHGEEQEARVAQDLLGFVPDPQVQQANEQADPNVRGDSQVCQDLKGQAQLYPVHRRERIGPRPPEALDSDSHDSRSYETPALSSRETTRVHIKYIYAHTHTHVHACTL